MDDAPSDAQSQRVRDLRELSAQAWILNLSGMPRKEMGFGAVAVRSGDAAGFAVHFWDGKALLSHFEVAGPRNVIANTTSIAPNVKGVHRRARDWMIATVRLPPLADIGLPSQVGGMSDGSRYAGMTLNERLFAAGLIEAFDAAKRTRDRAEMIRLLTDVDVDDAAWSADTILETPARIG